LDLIKNLAKVEDCRVAIERIKTEDGYDFSSVAKVCENINKTKNIFAVLLKPKKIAQTPVELIKEIPVVSEPPKSPGNITRMPNWFTDKYLFERIHGKPNIVNKLLQ
jgi:hypothetical protein